MNSINLRHISLWVAIGLLTAAFILGALLVLAGDVAAYQPKGRQVPELNLPEPPCPYGHDDVCEKATTPLLADINPYQSEDAHVHATDHHEHSDEQFLIRLSDFDAMLNDAGNEIDYAITSDITGLPWVTDNPSQAEKLTIDWLSLLQEHNPTLVTALTGMPFLQDHTPGDLQAIQTLTLISVGGTSLDPNPQYATSLANHSAFADDGGVDNTEAKIIAVTAIPYLVEATNLIDRIANEGTIEETTTQGQHGNHLTFATVRLGVSRQNSELMQSVVSATRHAETLMNQAFPIDFVGVLVVGDLVPGAIGANNSIHIWLDDGFDGTYSDRYRQSVVAHEIGHYYWNRGTHKHEAWISEGAAEYIGAYSVKQQFGDNSLRITNYPCPYYRTIEHLRADNPQYSVSKGSLCNYSLGESLFIDLDHSMGHAAFANGLRDLHQRLLTYEDDEVDQGLSLMRAFCSQCLTGNARLGEAGHVLARYYGERVFTDTRAATGTMSGLGSPSSVWLVDVGNDNLQDGVAEVPASSPDQRRWIRVGFSNATNPPENVRVWVAQYHEARRPYYSDWQERTVFKSESSQEAWFYVYLGNPTRRAVGHHWVYVYNGSGHKIANVEYQVIP